jgi:hypothetical protein
MSDDKPEEEYTNISAGRYTFTLLNAIANLLYFTDKHPRTVSSDIEVQMAINPDSEEFEIVEIPASDPSIIYFDLPVKKPKDINNVPALSHFPSYSRMTPEQRWIYWNWLQSPSDPIDIGYVFVFYYGLERHLVSGDFDLAFDAILFLQEHHHHYSFEGYSNPALFYSLLTRKRYDRLEEVLYLKGVNGWPVVGIMAANILGMNLTGADLMELASRIKGVNKRYVEGEPELFEEKLNETIKSKYRMDLFPFSERFKLSHVPPQMEAYANYSLSERVYGLPRFCDYAPFADEVKAILAETHATVKAILTERRRRRA